MKIALIGGPASGKTTVGQLLSKALALPCFDTDHLVEAKAGQSIASLFAEKGEVAFRDLETEALKSLLEGEDCIIATGGGIIKKAENRKRLEQAFVVYLNVSVPVQLQRTEGDSTRPLLIGRDKEAILTKLRSERDFLYQSIANIIVDADQKPERSVEAILQAHQRRHLRQPLQQQP